MTEPSSHWVYWLAAAFLVMFLSCEPILPDDVLTPTVNNYGRTWSCYDSPGNTVCRYEDEGPPPWLTEKSKKGEFEV